MFISDDKELKEIRVLIEDVIYGLYYDFGNLDGYQHRHLVTLELTCSAEILIEKAVFTEDIVSAVNDLLN